MSWLTGISPRAAGRAKALLAACWEETLEPGPYDFGDKDPTGARCSRATASSRSHSKRTLTYGPTYAFALGCYNGAAYAALPTWKNIACSWPKPSTSPETVPQSGTRVPLCGTRVPQSGTITCHQCATVYTTAGPLGALGSQRLPKAPKAPNAGTHGVGCLGASTQP